MSFAQFDDICEICYGMMEEDEALPDKKISSAEKLEKKEGLINKKKSGEIAAREIVKEKQRQLIYK